MTKYISPPVIISLITLLIAIFTSCESPSIVKSANYEEFSGEELAKIFCDSCHVFPDPTLLPKSAWEDVLPLMGHFMGIVGSGEDPYQGKGLQEGMYLEVAGVFPDKPALSDSSWQKLVTYVLEMAPDSLMRSVTSPLPVNELFEASVMSPDLGGFPAVCLLDYDEQNERLYVADVNGYFAELDAGFEETNFTQLINPLIKSVRLPASDELLLLDIGFLDPKDLPAGAIVVTDLETFSQRSLVFEQLKRPVDFEVADFNNDQQTDIVVCEFGNLIGSLSLFVNNGNGYEKKVIKDQPGALKIQVRDIDDNGQTDLIVLFAQGNEGVSFFYNEGESFRESQVIQLPPVYGCSDFEMEDMDGDGDLDIILTNGDNSSYSRVLKPYHGVRVYLNDGFYNFSEGYFYPMDGAYKVEVHDFDMDGDFDLFACSFYPDFEHGLGNSLVYLENKGNLEFEPSGFVEAPRGRWMVMDSGDTDRDGDYDIIIGSFALGPGNVPEDLSIQWKRTHDHLLFLENKVK